MAEQGFCAAIALFASTIIQGHDEAAGSSTGASEGKFRATPSAFDKSVTLTVVLQLI